MAAMLFFKRIVEPKLSGAAQFLSIYLSWMYNLFSFVRRETIVIYVTEKETFNTTITIKLQLDKPILKILLYSLFVLPKFCISIVFVFSWDLQWFQEKLETVIMQSFGGVNKENYGILDIG